MKRIKFITLVYVSEMRERIVTLIVQLATIKKLKMTLKLLYEPVPKPI